jgi:FkbM family methyltransferase
MKADLIFDVGMHKGEDTDFYLKKGFRVVGIEANPELAQYCRQRFASHIAAGALHIVEGAIVARDRVAEGPVTFYQNIDRTIWGTIDPQWRDRNVRLGCHSKEISVPCLDLGTILREHGVPFYMKIDIEGADRLCLDYLKDLDTRPQYLSLEDEKVHLSKLIDDIGVLSEHGYRTFLAVQQETIASSFYRGVDRSGRKITHQFEGSASGVFGTDLASRWMTPQEPVVEYKWIYEMYRLFGDDSPFSQDASLYQLRTKLAHHFKCCLPGWYDTHASLSLQ